MNIHDEHPFAVPESDRDPIRRLRARVGTTVSLWTCGRDGAETRGLTVSSYVVATGQPGHIVALLDPDADFVDGLLKSRVAVVQLLEWEHRNLAAAFAGEFPAPGGAWRLGGWSSSAWGPRLVTAPTWAGVRLVDEAPREVGWSILVDTVVEHVAIGNASSPLVHRRGRYQRPTDDP
jgi:flavin reductase (DIM6/NTAB) family NADH-FMN oxidoreductase RutF